MTICYKQYLKPVSSYHSQLLREDIVSCPGYFLLESHRRFVWVRADQVRKKIKSVVVLLVCSPELGVNPAPHTEWANTLPLNQFYQDFLLLLMVTHTCSPSSWKAEAGGSPPAPPTEWDLAPKAQSTFLSVGPISPAHMLCQFCSMLLRNTMWRILGQWETQWRRGDTCYVGRVPTGKKFRK